LGNHLRLSKAIDMQGTSVVRSKFASPEVALTKITGSVAVALITPARMPDPITSDGAVEWEWFVFDAPTNEDETHAECRTRRTKERPWTENRRATGAMKERLRMALSDKFVVLPTPAVAAPTPHPSA
jgi:hypothetical protein